MGDLKEGAESIKAVAGKLKETADRPLVSVAVPSYMNEKTIGMTIRSVARQTYRPVEIVICDDSSADRTFEVIREAESRYESEGLLFRTYRNEKRLGMTKNWNRCLSLCSGKYIKLLCGDDLISPKLIEREVEILERYPEVLSVESDTAFIDENKRLTGGYYRRYRKSGVVSGREIALYSLFHRDYFGAPLANTFRRDSCERYGGFDEDFELIPDYEFFMRLGLYGEVFIIHEALNFFRLRRGSNTSTVFGKDSDRYLKEHERLVRKFAGKLKLSEKDVRRSLMVRKIMNRLGGLYLKIFLKGKAVRGSVFKRRG
ncbi:MAG: glycosyltransferase [Lachnospiraceae bacterium]|nr:glycosyltransferase [Lachnospiraceae bacterium]